MTLADSGPVGWRSVARHACVRRDVAVTPRRTACTAVSRTSGLRPGRAGDGGSEARSACDRPRDAGLGDLVAAFAPPVDGAGAHGKLPSVSSSLTPRAGARGRARAPGRVGAQRAAKKSEARPAGPASPRGRAGGLSNGRQRASPHAHLAVVTTMITNPASPVLRPPRPGESSSAALAVHAELLGAMRRTTGFGRDSGTSGPQRPPNAAGTPRRRHCWVPTLNRRLAGRSFP